MKLIFSKIQLYKTIFKILGLYYNYIGKGLEYQQFIIQYSCEKSRKKRLTQ